MEKFLESAQKFITYLELASSEPELANQFQQLTRDFILFGVFSQKFLQYAKLTSDGPGERVNLFGWMLYLELKHQLATDLDRESMFDLLFCSLAFFYYLLPESHQKFPSITSK
jgi:hypothetical protein